MSAQRVMSEPHPDELIVILSIHKKDPNPEAAGRDPCAEMRPAVYQPASHIFFLPLLIYLCPGHWGSVSLTVYFSFLVQGLVRYNVYAINPLL